MRKLIELFSQAKNAFNEFWAFEKATKKSIVLSDEQKQSLEMWRKVAKETEVTSQQATDYKKYYNRMLRVLLLFSFYSCHYPQTVKTVVVAERITKKGSYQVICSDGLDNYVLSPFNRIPLGQRVDMDRSTHTFRIVSDLNGTVKIGGQ